MTGSEGTTLIELIVALAVLGIVLGVSTAALTAIHHDSPPPAIAQLRAARVRALRDGVAVRIDVRDSTPGAASRSVLLLPDGRVVGGGVDLLSGEAAPRASR